jgi:DNA (cytosine-5)-methyltransferase 1
MHHGMATPVLAAVGYGERDGQAARSHAVAEPLRAVVAGAVKEGLATPVMVEYYGQGQPRTVGQPLGTVVTHDRHAVVSPVAGEALSPGMIERGRLVAAMIVRVLGAGAVELDASGLVVVRLADGLPRVIVDVLFRMLRPRELAAAMGFEDSYVLPPQQRHAVRLVGNAVSPIVGAALIAANLPGGRERGGNGNGVRKVGAA